MKTIVWYLQLTRICNHKCIFCSNPANGKILSKEEIENALYELKNDWFTDVILTGWEPTLNPHLEFAIQKANEIWLKPRLITNGSKISDIEFLKKLIQKGLKIIHLSVYTYNQKLNDQIRWVKWAFKDMVKVLINTYKLWFPVQVTTVIFKQNQNHLLKNIIFIKKLNPNITHFVWNVLDPEMMPTEGKKNKDKILPDLEKAWKKIIKCFRYLENIWNTFRVEKMPLCFIPGYERANTECRKIIKDEPRKVIFLDQRGHFQEKGKMFQHWFKPECNQCDLKEICWGIYEYPKWYNPNVKPKKVWREYIEKIKKLVLKG